MDGRRDVGRLLGGWPRGRAAASGESPDEINTVILLVALDKRRRRRRRLVGLSCRLAVRADAVC